MRPDAWWLQVGNLRDSLGFFHSVFGMRVLRHEEFAEGCEATCNGP
jgi:catechol 2,3-dioxygenase-like lactoylglutathione lyase family enzyme